MHSHLSKCVCVCTVMYIYTCACGSFNVRVCSRKSLRNLKNFAATATSPLCFALPPPLQLLLLDQAMWVLLLLMLLRSLLHCCPSCSSAQLFSCPSNYYTRYSVHFEAAEAKCFGENCATGRTLGISLLSLQLSMRTLTNDV